MLKNKTKFMVLLLAFLVVISTFSFATDTAVTTSEDGGAIISTNPDDNTIVEGEVISEDTTTSETTESPDTTEIYDGDLYVFDNDITMNQLVDGNVFLFGSNVNITGKVNGSLYVFGDTVTFSEDSYIVQSIYVMANQLTLNGCANDLYALAQQVDMSYDSFMLRDLRVAANTFNFNGGVGRDAFVTANNFNFVTTENAAALVYGNLTYSSSNELSLTTDLVQGAINYTKYVSEEESVTDVILDKVVSFCNTLLYILVVFFLCLWLAPKFVEKTSSYISTKKCASSFGIGILTFIIAGIVGIALLFTVVGIPVGFALIGVLSLLLSIATAITCIAITYKLKEKFSFSKNYLTYLTLIGVVIVVWALKLIPYAGFIISILVKMIGLGIIVNYLLTRNSVEKNDKVVATETKKVEKPKKEKTAKKEDKKSE